MHMLLVGNESERRNKLLENEMSVARDVEISETTRDHGYACSGLLPEFAHGSECQMYDLRRLPIVRVTSGHFLLHPLSDCAAH